MRQVPKYLLIGNGRVARHFQHYFTLLQIPFAAWHRQEPLAKLHSQLEQATHILLLISDQAIDEFSITHLQGSNALRIHFSGSLVSQTCFWRSPTDEF